MKMIRAVIAVMVAAVVVVVLSTAGGSQAEVTSPTVPPTPKVQPSEPDSYLQEAKFAGVASAAQRRRDIWIWTVTVEKNRLAEEARIAEAQRVAAAKKRAAAQQRVTTAASSTPVRAVTGDVWSRLAQCESGNTNANTGNGYYGYFQFSATTWRSVGGTGLPTDHGYGEQLHRAQILQARSGWGQWPACSRKLGLR